MSENAPMMPLVVGAPRSGFTLLCSVLSHLHYLGKPKITLRQRLLNELVAAFGDHPAVAIEKAVHAAGAAEALVYSPAFRQLTGGPKWLKPDCPTTACFRKYIGLRGLGDFSLITSHPRQVLDQDDNVHSHVDPDRWLAEPAYADYQKFASVRSPVDLVNSSLLSINALTSEYLQRFAQTEGDDEGLRERLALFKFTNLDFFEGVARFYRRWYDVFLPVRSGYIVMRWEDLITQPTKTIQTLAGALDLPVDAEHATQIWARLSHRNLSGVHRHNFRTGGGRIGDWRRWMTNRHLEILEGLGFDDVYQALGFEPPVRITPEEYTPFQQQVEKLIGQGAAFEDYPDRDLFRFAFNKSNLDSDKFSFKRYGWKQTTSIERADFDDEGLLMGCWDAAEAAVLRCNTVFQSVLEENFTGESEARTAVLRVCDAATATFADSMPAACVALIPRLKDSVSEWYTLAEKGDVANGPPRLIRSLGRRNIVAYAGRFYAIPFEAGPVDLAQGRNVLNLIVQPSYRALLEAFPGADSPRPVVAAQPVPLAGAVERRAPAMLSDLELRIVEWAPEHYIQAALSARSGGAKTVRIFPWNSLAAGVAVALSRLAPDLELWGPAQAADSAPGVRNTPEGQTPDVSLLCHGPEVPDESLGQDLLAELPRQGGLVVAPKRPRHGHDVPLFIVSIPKAGTHLVYELARALGFADGGEFSGDPMLGAWHYLEYSNSHTAAPDFFLDSVRRSPFGNRHHPFPRCPVLFAYRHPLDILLSEANYYHREGNTLFAGYLEHLSFEERLLRLAEDPWLLGSLRDRVGKFAAWLEFGNVIPISYEELCGAQGGGQEEAQHRLVWSVLLKLRVSGQIRSVAARIYNLHSPTFSKGRIGRHRKLFTPAVWEAVRRLPQDFLDVFGYSANADSPLFSRRVSEFLHRPMRLGQIDHGQTPILVESGFFDYNILLFKGIYYAISRAVGSLDFSTADPATLRRFPASNNLGGLKQALLERIVADKIREMSGTR